MAKQGDLIKKARDYQRRRDFAISENAAKLFDKLWSDSVRTELIKNPKYQFKAYEKTRLKEIVSQYGLLPVVCQIVMFFQTNGRGEYIICPWAHERTMSLFTGNKAQNEIMIHPSFKTADVEYIKRKYAEYLEPDDD